MTTANYIPMTVEQMPVPRADFRPADHFMLRTQSLMSDRDRAATGYDRRPCDYGFSMKGYEQVQLENYLNTGLPV